MHSEAKCRDVGNAETVARGEKSAYRKQCNYYTARVSCDSCKIQPEQPSVKSGSWVRFTSDYPHIQKSTISRRILSSPVFKNLQYYIRFRAPHIQKIHNASDRLKILNRHIDACHSRQPLEQGERLVRYEASAVISSQ